MVSYDNDQVANICGWVKEVSPNVPVFAKMTPNVTNIVTIARAGSNCAQPSYVWYKEFYHKSFFAKITPNVIDIATIILQWMTTTITIMFSEMTSTYLAGIVIAPLSILHLGLSCSLSSSSYHRLPFFLAVQTVFETALYLPLWYIWSEWWKKGIESL